MRPRMNLASESLPDTIFEQLDDEHEVNQSAVLKEHLDSTTKTITQTSRLFLRKFAYSCTKAESMGLFQPFGEVAQVHVPIDRLSRQLKGPLSSRCSPSRRMRRCTRRLFKVVSSSSFLLWTVKASLRIRRKANVQI